MTVSDTSDWPASALHAADLAWAALTCDPDPLALDCDALGPDLDLPDGSQPLPVLREWLLRHPRAYTERDAVWRELILRARLQGPAWVIAAVGMAMPALVRVAAELGAGYPGERTDIDAEVLTGFLEELRDRADLTRPALYAGLCYAAFRAGRALRQTQLGYLPVQDIEQVAAGPMAPHRPYGHPDLLVERAQALHLIDPDDVAAYIDVRLGRRAIEPIAARMGLSVDALRMRLARADARLVQALASGVLTGVVCPEAVQQLQTKAFRRATIRAGHAATNHHSDRAAQPDEPMVSVAAQPPT